MEQGLAMAYLKDVPQPKCVQAGCDKRAKYTLVNRFNAPMGDYCGAHAYRAFEAAEKSEREHPGVRGDS
jgi:hypothetical protein